MGLLSFLRPERKSVSVLDLLPEFLRYAPVRSGVSVTWRSALEVMTVLACVRVLAEGVAQPKLKLYRTPAGGRRERVLQHPLLDVLGKRPNPQQSGFEFRETLMFHLALAGNAFVFVNRVGPDRRLAELIPIEPHRVTVRRYADLSLDYLVAAETPQVSGLGAGPMSVGLGGQKRFPAEAIWHLRGPSWNSWLGLDAVRLAREAIGLSTALEQTHADQQRNGAQTTGLYSVNDPLTSDQYAIFRTYLDDQINGSNRYKALILDRGARFTPTGMTGVDSQHLETRRHQIEEVCRAFRVMPIMVGHYDKAATYASAEQMFIAHVVHTITPWCARIEASAESRLTDPGENLDLVFDLRALMRGAAKDRAEFNAKALGAGGSPAWMTPNEVREDEGLDWIEGGDDLPRPVATAPAAPQDPASTGA